MHVHCPHCRSPIELVDESELSNVACPSCGSSFNLLTDVETITHDQSESRSIGHFRLVEQVGVGAFGSVWKARDRELDRTVAIKMPRHDQLDEIDTEQFLREARSAAQLKHPGIVAVHEVGREDGQVYIVSDFIEGVPLSSQLTVGRPTVREAVELCAKVAEALHHAHEAGVIHRDVKPSNIVIDVHGEPHVMDFGLAKREAGEITMTLEGKVLGTPAYMAPEQARGEAHHADRRSDVYSLGVVLFELLTEERPFRGDVRMLLHQVINEDAPSPRKLNANVPRDLETICLKCLEKQPVLRYPTAKQLVADLRRFLRKEPILARPVTRVERAWRWCRRNPSLATASMFATLALAVALVVSAAFAIYQSRAAANLRQEQQNTMAALAAAREQQRLAEDRLNEADRQRTLAKKRQTESEEQRKRAEGHFHKAREAVDLMLTEVGEKDLPQVPELEQTRLKLLQKALEFYRGFLTEESSDPSVRRETGQAYVRVADILGVLGKSEALIALSQDIREIGGGPGTKSAQRRLISHSLDVMSAGRKGEAETAYYRGLSVQQELVAESPTTPVYRQDLARTYLKLGRLLADAGKAKEAEKLLREAQAIQQRLIRESPSVAQYFNDLGATREQLGGVLRRRGNVQEANELSKQAVAQYQIAIDRTPHSAEYAIQLVQYYSDLTLAQLLVENHVGAATAAWESSQRLPDSRSSLYNAARVLAACVPLARKDGRMAEDDRKAAADKYAEQAVRLLEKSISLGFSRLLISKQPVFLILRTHPAYKRLMSFGPSPKRPPDLPHSLLPPRVHTPPPEDTAQPPLSTGQPP